MNASRLLQIVELMRAAEARSGLQGILANELVPALQQLAGNPAAAQWQQSLRAALDRLSNTQKTMRDSFTPEEADGIRELRGGLHFLEDFSTRIEALINANQATLAVAANEASAIAQQRQEYLAGLESLAERLETVGVEPPPLQPGEAELGVKIPRRVFDNTLDGLQVELRVLNRIIRALSEAATGTVDKAEVRQISTTDPVFVLGLPVATILLVAKCFTWALDTWKKVEDIRKIRAEVRKLDTESAPAIADQLEGDIEKKVRVLVQTQVDDLLGARAQDLGRPQEQRTDLTGVLELILDRVQRGVTVEVRLGPPASESIEDAGDTDRERAATFASLSEVSRQLVFPRITGEPLGFLTKPANDRTPPDTA